MAGGQPISMKNLRELREFTKKHKIPIIHDMTRVDLRQALINAGEDMGHGRSGGAG